VTASTRRPDRAGIAIALGLIAIAGIIVWDMSRLELATTYGLGPQAMPVVVAIGLFLLGIANLVMAWRGDLPDRESFDPRAILLILGGLAALIAVIGLGGGFIIATALLFVATATAFGRRALLVDLLIGLGLGLLIFLLFDKLLTLSLPTGPIERLL
jgi:putative tricarboxylic transport membrane protein